MSTPGQCFNTKFYPIKDFLSLSGALTDYLSEQSKLTPYVSTFQNLDALGKNITAKQKSFKHRDLLVTVLKKQNKNLELTELQTENLTTLLSDSTFTITTAHQTNLFGGPLYFIQKAVSVIKACQLAKETFPAYRFVPVYWLGTEDHDFEELNHTKINGNDIIWNDKQNGAFGRYKTDSLTTILQQVDESLTNSEHAEFIKELFHNAYKKGTTIAEATRKVLQQLLGEYGLLILDGDDKELKKVMIPYFKRELEDHFSTKAVSKSIQFLEANYGKTQAHSREINLFYLTDEFRKRIIKQPYGFSVYGTKLQFTKEKLLTECEENPERFSPNVMLRPLMQEICLPNLMYVGGGGEMTYWLQLKPIFEAANIPFPMLGLRDSAVYLSKKVDKKINELNQEVSFFFSKKEEVIKQLVKAKTDHSLDLTDAKQLVQQALSKMHQKAKAIDFTLSASAKAEEQRMINSITNLEKKMLRAEKKNHGILLERVNTIYAEIYPQGSLQERSQNFSQYYEQYGQLWIEWMIENFNLFDQQVKVMIEK